MQKACFIISLDCEGKWGFADRIGLSHDQVLTHQNLHKAYDSILRTLADYNLKATFAFVAAFTLSEQDYLRQKIWFSERLFAGKNWLDHFKRQVEQENNTEGWFAPDIFVRVREHQQHEIATHGFTHLPFQESLTSRDAIEKELAGINAWATWQGLDIKTMVFPRNRVGYTDLLVKAGIQAYRDMPLYFDMKPRWAAEALKYIEGTVSQPHPKAASPLKIPGGSLMAFRRQYRLPPNFMILKRWQAIIDHAVEHKQVAHLWMHPHNMINGLDQAWLFREILKYAAGYIEKGQLHNLTQQDYWSAYRG